ncbi:MAG: hypothetical protein E7617_05595 [Ruminococcaceae bacterium]|nr:hypothetical protein [Oscillospiraceae bacterium]
MKSIETEIKLIIEKPDAALICAMPDYTESEILQIYIASPDATHRVRRRAYSDGRVEYTENKKRRISKMSSVEEEREIGKSEFELLARSIESGASPVIKTRRTFSYGGRTVEIDSYPAWKNSCILEVELPSESDIPKLPECIRVLLDVTGDKKYSNHSMAHSFPEEII